MASRAIGEDTERFRKSLLADVLDHAETEGQEAFLPEAFTDLVLDELEQRGEWPDYQLVHHRAKGARVDAWGLDEGRRILYLAATDFSRTSEAPTIGVSEVDRVAKRLAGFVDKARRGRIQVEDHNPVADLVDLLAAGNDFDEIHLHLILDRVSTAEPKVKEEADIAAKVRVWDLESIRRMRTSGARLEPIDVQFEGIPALNGGGKAGVETYLLFVPATAIADLYQSYGARLLERNVRAFLSARGKVNRGLRETLRNEPERFLAYNNGLTATAAGVEFDDALRTITKVSDLQIVNGGQTTASIAQAAREPDTTLGNVFVQMKLVVVDADLIDELVPNISRFANRQNAVQESDLSANHPFLRRLQEASRTEYTPPSAAGRPTKWYFERARGAYGVDEGRAVTAGERRRFESDYPRSQRFGKNELALYENTWSCLPHLVSRGGQKNFTEFMLRLEDAPNGLAEAQADEWYRARFRHLVAKAIIFKAADKTVHRTLGGTYKRAVTAYTLSYILSSDEHRPNLDEIWRVQSSPEYLIDAVTAVAPIMKERLITSAAGRNITEWAKNETCWETLRQTKVEMKGVPAADQKVSPTDSPTETTRPAGTVPRSGSSDGTAAPSAGSGLRAARGEALADLIEQVHGEPIHGRYRRYRRKAWNYLGDTEIPASRGGTLHAYEAEFNDGMGSRYRLTVVVDYPARTITPADHLPTAQRDAVEAWSVDPP